MKDEKVQSLTEQISGSLSEALFRANKAKGVIIIMAEEDDSIWTFSAGDLVTRLGLLHAAGLKGQEIWNTGRAKEDNPQ